MNRLLTSALAFAAVGSIGTAGSGDGDWLELDSEINGLASSVATQGDWMNIKALLRGFYNYSSDPLATGEIVGSGFKEDDTSGLFLADAEVNGNFQVGDVKLRIGFDFAREARGRIEVDDDGDIIEEELRIGGFGLGVLQDAFAIYGVNEDVSVRAGQYKPHILRSNYVDPEKQFFPYRSALGAAGDWYDLGVGVFGDVDALSWSFDIFNGENTHESGHLYLLRVLWNMGREAGQYETTPEDAYGAGDELALTVGGTVLEDDVNTGDAGIYALDALGSVDRFGFGAEVAFIGEDAMASTPSDWNGLFIPLTFGSVDSGGNRDSSTAWAIHGSFLPDDRFGVGARLENLDNTDDNTVLTIAGNMYDAGHNGKLQAAVSFISTDDTASDDTTVFTVGYTFGGSR